MRFAIPALFVALFVIPAVVLAVEPKPLKVGIIGLDNYQAVAFTQLYHDPKATGDLAGIRVVAAFPIGSPDIEESVRELPKWTKDIQQSYKVPIVASVDARRISYARFVVWPGARLTVVRSSAGGGVASVAFAAKRPALSSSAHVCVSPALWISTSGKSNPYLRLKFRMALIRTPLQSWRESIPGSASEAA